MTNASEHALAVLVDIENMARPGARNRGEFDIHLVLNRLAEKGRVVVKRAYADWSRYRDARRELMNAGLELIEMPSAREGAKNRADIKMAVDAMEIAYSRQHVDNFVIVSGDSDFTPLVGKLRELNKRVIGVGRDMSSASPLLIANCDEFFFYDSLASKALPHHVGGGVRPDALTLLRETLMARSREGDEHPQASAVKDSMRRRDPAFDEGEIGYATFSKFLEDAQSKGVVRLQRDPRSGTFAVELVDASAPSSDWPSLGEERPPAEITEGRRRRRRRRGGEGDAAGANGAPAEGVESEEAEVFEFEVRKKEFTADLPPLDQPITYEDIVLSGDELEIEPVIVDVVEDDDAPPTRGSRRRRRSLSTVPEPGVEDLDTTEPVAAATEAESTSDEVAAATAEAEPATTSRRRVRRGSVLPQLTTDDEAAASAVDAVAAEPAVAEAPKPRTRTRRKPAADTVVEEAPAAEEADADKPKRRPRKKAEDEVAAAVEVEAAVEAPAEETATSSRRRPRKKAGDDVAANADETPEAAPKPRVRSRKKADDEGTDAAPLRAGESPY